MLIIFLDESNGHSFTLGYAISSSYFLSPCFTAKLTSAASVGSPSASSLSLSIASQHKAIAVAICLPSPTCSVTVILFCVRVPVLSEQIIWVHPRVSTAVSLLTTAFSLDILVTPIDKTTVTTVASPSGIAATASDTATMNIFRIDVRLISFDTNRSKTNMNTHIKRTRYESFLPSSLSLI